MLYKENYTCRVIIYSTVQCQRLVRHNNLSQLPVGAVRGEVVVKHSAVQCNAVAFQYCGVKCSTVEYCTMQGIANNFV